MIGITETKRIEKIRKILIEKHNKFFVQKKESVDCGSDPCKYHSVKNFEIYPHAFLLMILANVNIGFDVALKVPGNIRNIPILKGTCSPCFLTA